jgi:hypothetical protein
VELQREAERIAVAAITEADAVVAVHKLPFAAQLDLLETIANVIDAHRDRVLEAQGYLVDNDDDL